MEMSLERNGVITTFSIRLFTDTAAYKGYADVAAKEAARFGDEFAMAGILGIEPRPLAEICEGINRAYTSRGIEVRSSATATVREYNEDKKPYDR